MSGHHKILLSTSYFGPVQYFSKFLLQGDIFLEQHEHFIKQTYRNRCILYGANGPLILTVPVKRGSFHKVMIGELEIDYRNNWQGNHCTSIESAYRSTPFFEFYYDEIFTILKKRIDHLFELNLELLKLLLSFAGIDKTPRLTEQYEHQSKARDYRSIIDPKKPGKDPLFKPVTYPQVFGTRYGFLSNLSILDLLFNTGPDVKKILERSIDQSSFRT